MKYLICFLLAFSAINSFSESIPKDIWVLKSDKKDAAVNKNICLITGNVYEAFSEVGIEGGIVSNLSRTNSCKTNANGDYSLEISCKDTAIFFYHESYVEIVCWKYEFKGGHHVEMDFVCSEKLADGMMYIEEKPVIYAYSDKNIDAHISLSNSIDLTFTYPKYKDGWQINVAPDKGISFEDQFYPYLFWEGEKSKMYFDIKNGQVEGYFVKTDSIVSFFENSLNLLGLNLTESTDFITYWGPRLQQSEYATVQFLVDEKYDKTIGEMIVSPAPDAKRRIYLLFQQNNTDQPNVALISPQLTTFKRVGFTIVEWGGTELRNPQKF